MTREQEIARRMDRKQKAKRREYETNAASDPQQFNAAFLARHGMRPKDAAFKVGRKHVR